ncbi:immunoglobulin-like and fibronectin type III domain-containing protein 1 isoform X2 [Rhineura floridana]|uniref:immunoglobulin-like and fibronectin type III domain-containing protein 1 isoform X2 n=1 Tax=Rhineura floridana TaxID=261503 RepID=UPI002AC86DA0|nr:immunoglobulin-like and fibronectin type III domain-containing protein 1 isoform X2 [Rhineura floridana]
MAGRRGVKTLKRSAIPGVTITQCVENIPEGCSTPDFERKPITVTLQEGKNAIFRAVVKGEPQPEVLWKRNSKEMDDPQKYQISFSPGANEFILQVNKITSEDADLYRCTAVNEYGEATCTAGLKIIQVGFKKKPKEIPSVPQADLKKEIQDFRKTLKKRAPSTTPKKEIDMEQVWQLLLNADRKDYEKICLKYGIVDFRGMLRRLQEMKKEREDEQAQYVLTLTNLRHVRVNEDQGNASFDLEMELKHPESRIYLYKDGQVINFGFDSDNVKHCLQNIGKKYNFIINDLQPEDAGMYQIKVEDVDIFSTELEAESIPVSFRYPLGEVRCHEQGNAAFQCTLYEACFDSVWLHKTHHLEANDKYDILVSDDGLIHRLVIKNAQASDKGTYTIDIGSRSSSAWLEVESKGKRKQIEGNSDDKTGWQNKQLDEDHAKKLHQGKGHDDQDGQYRNGQDANGESYGSLGKDGSLGRGRADRDGKMGQFSGVGIDMAEGNQFSGFAGSSMGLAMLTGNAVSEGMGNLAGIGSLYGKDSMSDGTGAGTRSGGAGGLQTSDSSTLNGAGPSDRFSRAHSMGSQDSMLGSADVASDRCGVGGVDGAGAGLGVPGKAEGFYGKKGGLRSAGGVGARLDSAGGLSSKDDGLDGAGGPGAGFGGGPAGGLYSKDGMLERVGMSSAGGRGGVGEDGKLDGVGIIGAGARGEGRIYGSANSHGAGLDGIVGLYGKDGRAGADGPGGAVGVGEHYGKDGMPGGAGSGGPGGVGGLYGKDDVLPRSGTGASGGFYGKDGMGPGSAGGLYGKDGMTTEAGIGAPGGAGGTDGLYDKDMLDGGGASAGGPGGAGGIGGFYDQDGMLGGAGPSAAGGIGGLHGKDGIPFGGGANGPSAAGGAGGLYGKDGMQAGTGGAMGVGGLYGKDGMLGSARAGGAGGNGGLCGKNAMLCGAGPGGPGGAGGFGGLYGKDGMLVSGTTSGPGGAVGISGLYSKEGLPVGGGTGEPSDTGGVGGLYGKNGMLSGAGAGGLGGTGGIGGLYGKDGMPVSGGTGGPGSTGDIGGLYGKDDLPVSRGNDGPGDARGVGGLYGKDGMLAGAGAAGGGLYGKDGLSVGGDIGGPGGAGGTGGLYDKDGMLAGAGGLSGAGGVWGLYGKYGMVGGAGAGGPGSTGVIGRLYGKDGMPVNGSTNGSSSTGDIGGLYGKDGLPVGKGNGGPGGAGEVGGLYGKDGLPVGRGNGGPGGAGEVGGLYGKAYMIDGAEVGGAGRVGGYYGKDGILDGDGDGGPGSADRVGGLHGKDGVLGGAGAGRPGDAAGVAGLYGQDITLGGAGLRGATDTGGLYGRDGMPGGPGAGGARGVGGLYSKDAMLAAGGSGSAGGIGGLYDKDGMPGGTGTAGTWGTGALCGKDCILGGAGGTGSAGGIDGFCCKDGMPGGTGVGGAGGMCGTHGKNSLLVGAGAELRSTGGRGGLHGQDSILGGAGLGNGGSTGENSGKAPMYEGDSIPGYGLDGTGAASDMQGGAGSAGLSSAENMRGHHGKEGVFPGAGGAGLTGLGGTGDLYDQACTLHGSSAGSASAPLGGVGKTQELHSQGIMMDGTGGDGTKDDVRGAGYDEGGTGSLCGKDCRLCGTGAGGLSGEGWLGNLCDRDIRLGGVGVGPGNRGVDGSQYEKMSNIPGEEFLGYGQSSGLFDAGTHAGNRRRQLSNLDASGHPSSDISRTKDRKGRGGSLLEGDVREPHCCFNQGLFDLHALKGKPAALTCSLNNDKLEGTWFKDGFKIIGLDGVSIEKDGPVHKLIIDEVQDSHAGKYQFEAEGVRTEASIFAEDPPNVDSALLEKLQKEPIVVKAGKNAIVKIPFEGRKPIRATWLKDEDELLDDARISIDYSDNFTRLSISSTHRMDCGEYKVKLKNKCGSAEATFKLVVTAKPQPPMGPVEVMDSSRSGITIQWKPPKDDGGKPVQSYIIEKQQVGRTTWVTLGRTGGSSTIFTTNKVEADKSYYFKVKAVNTEGTSEALESDEVMAATKAFPGRPAPPKIVSANKDAITLSWTAPHKIGNSQILGYSVEKCKKGSNTWTPITDLPIPEPPGPVRDLKVVSTDYCSISLSWMKPEAEEESHAKGYVIEMRHTDTLKWTQYNALPIPKTTYTVRGLKAREMYFLRVRAINNGGFGEHVELDTCVQAVPATVHPKLLVKDIIKSFMIVKAGNTIRLRIPFEAFPTPEVLWLKDGLSLPAKATIATREGLSQLIIPGANFSDSGHYAIILQTEGGNKETFSILVQVLDIPESPGPIQLIEKVPDTVTLMWEPSPTEKREGNLNYMVMRRDSNKGLWELVADLIYTNKYTVSNFVPGREYFFRVLAKNCMGISEPSETVQPWSIHRDKGKFEVSLPKYKGINETQPPRFLVPLKPHVVTLGFDCHMSCAVTGYPVPQVTWYKDGKNLSQDPTFFCKNDFGVCSLVILGVTPTDGGQYEVVAINELGQAVSKAEVTIKEPTF